MSLAIYADTPVIQRAIQEGLASAGLGSDLIQNNQGHVEFCICVGQHPAQFSPFETFSYRLDIILSQNANPQKNKGTAFFEAPVRFGELIDHIVKWRRTLLRTPYDDIYKIGAYILKTKENILEFDQGVTRLTDKEKDILAALMSAPQKTLNRRDLMDRVWAYAEGVETHTLETHIYRLRQKIEKDPANPVLLVTLPDGYAIKV